MLMANVLSRKPVVLYAPNSTLVRSLINQLNSTSNMINKMNEYAAQWLENSDRIKEYLQINREKIAKSLNQSLNHGDVRALTRRSDQLIDILGHIDLTACSWLQLTSSINLDIFKGFANEDDLVSYFLDEAFNSNETVISSIVFTNVDVNTTELPPLVNYKIRQNASLTLNTKRIRDRYWFPSTKTSTYFYYIFGFVWLQDLVDRAIIDYHANQTVYEPGTYIRQMPYPCFMNDDFLIMIEDVRNSQLVACLRAADLTLVNLR